MRLEALVGKMAVRREETSMGGKLFICEPAFVLSYVHGVALVSVLDPLSSFEVGTTITLSDDYLDDLWIDYGSMLNGACNTKAQVITQMLAMLGIVADKQSMKALCRAVTYKQMLQEISDALEIGDLLHAMGAGTETPVDEPITVGSGWDAFRQGENFVRRRLD